MRKHNWTNKEIRYLEKTYPNTPTHKMAESLNLTVSQVYNKVFLLGLKKSKAYLESPFSGRLREGTCIGGKGRFKKGHAAWNKGMKGLCLGGEKTRFKPGHLGGKALEVYKPIGFERLSKDGYLERKIRDGKSSHKCWRAVHLLVWEEANGQLPNGYAILFKDGNKQNITLENLELISRADLMRRNSIHNYGPEIAKLYQLKGAINRQINRNQK